MATQLICEFMLLRRQGKTTFIAPLLALLLADGRTLVTQVVPASLLHFSRSVMWRAFSGVIMPKPIFTFESDRRCRREPYRGPLVVIEPFHSLLSADHPPPPTPDSVPLDRSLLARLERARDASGVVLATPTSLKSFSLKFLELAREYAQMPSDDLPTGLSLGKLQLNIGPRRRFGGADDAKAECEHQLMLCAKRNVRGP